MNAGLVTYVASSPQSMTRDSKKVTTNGANTAT